MLTDIKVYSAAAAILSRWLIIQSRCFTASAQMGAGAPSLYLADIKQQSGGLAVNFAAIAHPERRTDAVYRSDSPSLSTVLFFLQQAKQSVVRDISGSADYLRLP